MSGKSHYEGNLAADSIEFELASLPVGSVVPLEPYKHFSVVTVVTMISNSL